MQYLRENGCAWSYQAFHFALAAGHKDMCQWLYANGCPCDKKVFTHAINGGNLELFKWLESVGCTWDSEALHAAKYRAKHKKDTTFLEYMQTHDNDLVRA